MKVFSQCRHTPSQVLFAFDEVVSSETSELRWAVAYATYRGCETLIDRISTKIGSNQWDGIPKRFIVSLDFGITDPSALQYLQDLNNSSVYIANPEVVNRNGFRPIKAFHPKLFLFNSPQNNCFVVGSANLTESALLTNTEVVMSGNENPDNSSWADVWATTLIDAVLLSPDLLQLYRSRRGRQRYRIIDPDPVIPVPVTLPRDNPVLWSAVAAGFVPPSYTHFWIQAGSMSSGGSRNQLELPRSANQFFGYGYLDYDDDHVTIGYPLLTVDDQSWEDRPLTWHGNNRMERINLPTISQGGFRYQGCAVLFRRHAGGFEIKVSPWDGATALSWRGASESMQTVFRLGSKGTRICGFF
jgi:hypothetical protein